MAQWDVHAVRGGGYALNVQSDLLEPSGTRLVIPLVPASETEGIARRLCPAVLVGDLDLHAMVLLTTALPLVTLGPRIASAEHAREDVTRALDMVLSGV